MLTVQLFASLNVTFSPTIECRLIDLGSTQPGELSKFHVFSLKNNPPTISVINNLSLQAAPRSITQLVSYFTPTLDMTMTQGSTFVIKFISSSATAR